MYIHTHLLPRPPLLPPPPPHPLSPCLPLPLFPPPLNNQGEIRKSDEHISAGHAKPPPKPNGRPSEDIDQEIRALEHERETTTMTLKQEKELLQRIKGITKDKAAWDAVEAHYARVRSLKEKRSENYENLGQLRDAIRELSAGIQKVEVFTRVCEKHPDRGLTPADIVTIDVPIPEDQVGNIIGRGGSRLRSIEDDCGVSLNMDRRALVVSISGVEDGVQQAQSLIEEYA